MLLTILMAIFGVVALIKGGFKITSNRRVKESMGRTLGVMLLLGAGAVVIPGFGGIIQIVFFILVIIIGLSQSEKIERDPGTPKTSD